MIVLIVVTGIHKIQQSRKICSDFSVIVPESVWVSLLQPQRIKLPAFPYTLCYRSKVKLK